MAKVVCELPPELLPGVETVIGRLAPPLWNPAAASPGAAAAGAATGS